MTTPDDESASFLRFSMPALIGVALVLSAGTGFVFLYTASEEPFFSFDAQEFAVVVVLGGALAVGWLFWGAALGASVEKARHVALLIVSGPWLLANLAALAFCIHGYFQDLRTLHRLHEGTSSVRCGPAYETLEAFVPFQEPEITGFVAGGNEVSAHGQATEGGTAVYCGHAVAGDDAPHLDLVVARRGDDLRAIRTVRAGADPSRVTVEAA
jgi:hypothetical protein